MSNITTLTNTTTATTTTVTKSISELASLNDKDANEYRLQQANNDCSILHTVYVNNKYINQQLTAKLTAEQHNNNIKQQNDIIYKFVSHIRKLWNSDSNKNSNSSSSKNNAYNTTNSSNNTNKLINKTVIFNHNNSIDDTGKTHNNIVYNSK